MTDLTNTRLFSYLTSPFGGPEEAKKLPQFKTVTRLMKQPYELVSVTPWAYGLDLGSFGITRDQLYKVFKVTRDKFEFLYRNYFPLLVEDDLELTQENLDNLNNLVDQGFVFGDDKDFIQGLSTGTVTTEEYNHIKNIETTSPILLPQKELDLIQNLKHGDVFLLQTSNSVYGGNLYLAFWVSKVDHTIDQQLDQWRRIWENRKAASRYNYISLDLSNIPNINDYTLKLYFAPGSWGELLTLDDIKEETEVIESSHIYLDYRVFVYPDANQWIGMELVKNDDPDVTKKLTIDTKQGLGSRRVLEYANSLFVQVNRVTSVADRESYPVFEPQSPSLGDQISAELVLKTA